jgi:replicative DNA helicase
VKRLLRSVVDFDQSISSEQLIQNFQKLVQARMEWSRPDDARIYDFLVTYFQQRLELPSGNTVADYFDKTGDVEVVERIKDVQAAPWYVRTNFAHLLQTLLEDQNRIKATALLKEAHEIINKGLVIQDGREKIRKQGVREGLVHFQQRAHELIIPDFNARTSGDIRLDGQSVWDEYQDAKVNKDKVWGRFTGLNAIDIICHGIKKGELWVHAGFPGELKTTFSLNWCYNLVTRYRANVLYFSLEMPYEQIRRQIYVIHSTHARWRAMGYKPLDYRKVRDGELTPEEEVFYQKVIDDFSNNQEYCQFEIRSPDRDMTIDDIRLETELTHKQMEVGLVVIDHGQLLEARKAKRSKDYVVELNSIVRDTKKFCLHFNHGEKIPTLMLFQINRQGKEEANKNEGRYKASALAYANEVEKSSDVITTTYLNDEHRQRRTTLICNLKNRDNPLFEPFMAQVDFPCRRISNLDMYQGSDGRGMGVEDHAAVLEAMANV